jgi:hypothetical protein
MLNIEETWTLMNPTLIQQKQHYLSCCLNEKSTPIPIPNFLPFSSVGVGGLKL